MWRDPIVDEIRKHRQKIEADNNNDFDKIIAQAMKFQKQFENRLVSKPGVKKQKTYAG